MGFEMFVVTLSENDHFDRAIVERAFAPFIRDPAGDYWNFNNPDGEFCFLAIAIDDTASVDGFMVSRPPSFEGFPQFWNGLFEVLRQTRAFLIWPAEGPHPTWCVANLDYLRYVPADFIDDFGKPAFATSGEEIDAAVTLTGH